MCLKDSHLTSNNKLLVWVTNFFTASLLAYSTSFGSDFTYGLLCKDFYSLSQVGSQNSLENRSHVINSLIYELDATRAIRIVKPPYDGSKYYLGSSNGALEINEVFHKLEWTKSGPPQLGQTLTFAPRPEPLEIEKRNEIDTGVDLRLVDPLGKRIFLRYSRLNDSLEVIDSRDSSVPLTESLLPLVGHQINDKIPVFKSTVENIGHVSAMLGKSQEAVAAKTHKHQISNSNALKNVVDANHYLLKLNRPITLGDFEEVNKIVNKGLLVGEQSLFAGVTRGTKKIVQLNEENVLVDLTEYSRYVWMNGIRVFEVMPATFVASRIQKLIQKINGLTPNSSLSEAVSVFQEIVLIHPFVDGNKRTSRIFVDYALRKIGAPPFPHAEFSSHPFYKSAFEIEVFYRRFYGMPL